MVQISWAKEDLAERCEQPWARRLWWIVKDIETGEEIMAIQIRNKEILLWEEEELSKYHGDPGGLENKLYPQ